ncbi:MAG: 2-amino-4-hydroxy-6-hydroxymethyldihydropteridine diphosphokinase [Gemmatimonadota bacterium]
MTVVPAGGEAGVETVILALGSNLGDRRAHMERGLDFLSREVRIVAVSRLVESAPYGPVRQPDFLNLVARGETSLAPLELLDVTERAEAHCGRERTIPMGPRTLDVDIVFHGAARMAHPRLTLPHPRWQDRPFVSDLAADVGEGLVDPVSGRVLRPPGPLGSLHADLREVPPLSFFPEPPGARP